MTHPNTNPLAVIEQQNKALEFAATALTVDSSGKLLNPYKRMPALVAIDAALTAGRQALEKAQGEESDAGFFSREAMMAHHILKDYPQASEPAPSPISEKPVRIAPWLHQECLHQGKCPEHEWCTKHGTCHDPDPFYTGDPKCTCLTSQLGPDYCEVHAA